MLFAFDENDCRVYIDDTHSNKTYYCPYCGVPMITKRGDFRHHHFAHSARHYCSDTWADSYDVSPWHNEWQMRFPKENQEVKLALGETKHRADALIGRTVIEFQHSVMSVNVFNDRNNFYFNLNYKVIWLFDLTDIMESGHLSYEKSCEGLSFRWINPKKVFNSYDVKTGCVDLFFQISSSDTGCIVQVTDVSEAGFESFSSTLPMSKNDFLEYTGLVNGVCPPPKKTDEITNESYLRFKEQYGIRLNPQQERTNSNKELKKKDKRSRKKKLIMK